jgi:hypothetical protein
MRCFLHVAVDIEIDSVVVCHHSEALRLRETVKGIGNRVGQSWFGMRENQRT